MKIGIDAHSAYQRKSGIGVYTANLIRALKESGAGHEYVLYGKGGAGGLRTPGRIARESTYLALRGIMDRLDLLHVPGYGSPLLYRGKLVVTVHDLIGMLFPENLSLPSRFYWGTWLPLVVSKADRILADSHSTKRDIMRLLGFPESRIHVIHLAADPRFRPMRDPLVLHQVKRRYNISHPFALYVGNIEPRKNLVRVMEAWAALRGQLSRRHQLVVAGLQAWAYQEVSDLVRKLGIKRDVVFTGYVRDEELPLLYNAGELLVFPSLYEGFGMPVLEAMACEIPVLTSDTSSIPEIAGDAAVMVGPTDMGKIAQAMGTLLEDRALREELIGRGRQQAARFTWQRTAAETLKVYEEVGGVASKGAMAAEVLTR